MHLRKMLTNGMLVGALTLISLNGCISAIDWRKMKLDAQISSRSQLLNLQNFTKESELYQAAQRMTAKGFFDTGSEEYGFYTIDIRYTPRDAGGILWATLDGVLLGIPILLGVPVDASRFELVAYLNIFDSNGDLVQTLSKGDSFVQMAGLYYGHNPTPKADGRYAKLFEALFQEANEQAGKLNPLLQAAGPVKPEKAAAARSKIAAFQQ